MAARPDSASSRRSDRQTFATLGATRVDDGAATGGLHARAETVRTLAAHNGRLIGTFHDESPTDELKKFAIRLVDP